MSTTSEIKVKAAYLKLQQKNLEKRYARILKREAFVKKHKKQILGLSTEGWPRLTAMKDRHKWMRIFYEAKIQGVYSISTANCDVIANLSRFAKEL